MSVTPDWGDTTPEIFSSSLTSTMGSVGDILGNLDTFTFLIFIISLLVGYYVYTFTSRLRGLPPGPMAFPVVGNLPQLVLGQRRTPLMYELFEEYRAQYGDMFRLSLGSKPMVIVMGKDLVRQILVTKGQLFLRRPGFYLVDKVFQGLGKDLALSAVASPIAKTLGSSSIRYLSGTFASDRCLVDVDPIVFALWGVGFFFYNLSEVWFAATPGYHWHMEMEPVRDSNMTILNGVGSSIVMMTSLNGSIFRVTGLFCGEFTGHRRIPCTKASDAELWCFIWSAPETTVEQIVETLVIWDAIALIMTSL